MPNPLTDPVGYLLASSKNMTQLDRIEALLKTLVAKSQSENSRLPGASMPHMTAGQIGSSARMCFRLESVEEIQKRFPQPRCNPCSGNSPEVSR